MFRSDKFVSQVLRGPESHMTVQVVNGLTLLLFIFHKLPQAIDNRYRQTKAARFQNFVV